MHPTCPGFVDIAKEYQNIYRPPPKPSCHCAASITNATEKFSNVDNDNNFFKHDIALGLLDIHGRPLKGKYSEFGQFQPKELHEFQYASLNKNPSYFLDLSQNVGLRPIVRASDIEAPPQFKYDIGTRFINDTNCNQPYWQKSCI